MRKLATAWMLAAFLFLGFCSSLSALEHYRLRFSFSGRAQGVILLFFRFRFFYEAAAELELTAKPDGEGGLFFQLERISSPAHVMRTLGFTGKGLAMMTAFTDYETVDRFSRERVAGWQKEYSEFSKFIRKVKRLPFLVENIRPDAFGFRRSVDGVVSEASSKLRLHYKHFPQETGIYFRVYDLMAEMLAFYNHGVWPSPSQTLPARLSPSWISLPIDLTTILTRVGAQTEKIVASSVKFNQEKPFDMMYRLSGQEGERLELLGESRSHPRIWKNFRLKVFNRVLTIRRTDQHPLRDEIRLVIENEKGLGARGYLLLERIDSRL